MEHISLKFPKHLQMSNVITTSFEGVPVFSKKKIDLCTKLFSEIKTKIEDTICKNHADFEGIDLYYKVNSDYIGLFFFIGKWDFDTYRKLNQIKCEYRGKVEEQGKIELDWVILPKYDFHDDEEYAQWNKWSLNRDGK